MKSSKRVLSVSHNGVSLSDLRVLYTQGATIRLDDEAWRAIGRSEGAVADIVAAGKAVYGINTGFGLLAQTRIPDQDLALLQRNLVLSHSTGVGTYLDERTVRLVIGLKIYSLSQGHSGVSAAVVQGLIDLLDHDITPCIPCKGSVGASGDLAPLAHMSCALLGVGDVFFQNQKVPASQALSDCGLSPIQLGPKEGLALLNGTQMSTAYGLAGLFDTENLFAAAVVAGAMSVDALKGSTAPFDARIHQLRRQPGQIAVAEKYLQLLEGSRIRDSHINCDKVQDPYSLRCQPQVMGACLDLMRQAAGTLLNEANAVTDNPLVFVDPLQCLSGGNFHAEPVAFAADTLALAIAEIASISERRISLLVDPKMNGGLPAFLVENSGLNSGFMIAQVTAAALVSENKSLAHPASVDSIPTSANQEDHVSMAAYAGRRLRSMTENSIAVVAVELLAAAQAIEWHAPQTTSTRLQAALGKIRSRVGHYAEDRFFATDITHIIELINESYFYSGLKELLPSAY